MGALHYKSGVIVGRVSVACKGFIKREMLIVRAV